ncbi:MAG: DUF1800 domain-containing protein, partial [Verrucomicrobia bacterium]|nr:DUF1800 domain-containing protein [Verrucomicrobiota bacterium]
FRRSGNIGSLTVKFTLGDSAVRGTHYTASAVTSITIPDGERESWLEIAPTGKNLNTASVSVLVTLQPNAAYGISTALSQQTATVTIGNISPLPNAKAAVRFLNQGAFGPNGDFKNVQEVMTLGFDAWLTDQFARPVGLQQPYVDYIAAADSSKVCSKTKTISWWNRAMEVPSLAPGSAEQLGDPLRQRVGFALSEIMVVSDTPDELHNQPAGMANYYDVLLKGAFGNFRDLLYNISVHPCMGIYLNALQNQKGDPSKGTFADENFAREIMQLFSVGIWELNLDGTRKLDSKGQPIPTYDNTTIANMARVMTGFSWGGPDAKSFLYARRNFIAPMRMWDKYHDLGAKTLLNGVKLPARTASKPDTGAAGMADFNAAIDCLFNHPSTAPFICRQLIQKLVTSNPSPAYVARVASKFVNNGKGVRGDLKCVIRAILLDTEARNPQQLYSSSFGKMKEPYLRTVNFARAFNARSVNGVYALTNLGEIHFQQPQNAPSVFNFFKPGYAPEGLISNAGLVAPEFQILNSVTSLSVPNYYYNIVQKGYFNRWGSSNPEELVIGLFENELALAADVPALLSRLDLLLTGGTLPNEQHQVIREAVEKISLPNFTNWQIERIRLAVYLITASPEYAILR